MVQITLHLALPFLVGVLGLPNPHPLAADSSGDKNVGNGQGQQFITGGCLSDADCQSECCATLSGGGICSAKAAANEGGKQGCGFGDAAVQVTTTAAAQAPAGTGAAADTNTPGGEDVGTGNGEQFITGQCTSDADCASGCCAGSGASANGACSAVAVANANGKTGCGFVQV
ncbi:hypothetical protein FZEAL_3560 [Fusarium zealandicum]|uniref:Biotrophy-associated secreted protein 2 n=1 Tax=Fusarium zealandicum TaxID=1053134 RepID=A0A8H4UNK4_9HYPO|nr:hypothetical protein FZEAL_3560 [Fusarium zealandicum]